MDESSRYKLGTYPSLEAAIEASKRIVDEFLLSSYKPGMTADRLYQGYVSFGEDPFIIPADAAHLPFSAWEYAKTRCEELCKDQK
jgi:hypothetical protein